MLAESVAEPTSSFADVTRGACTTSNDVNELLVVHANFCRIVSGPPGSVDLGR